MSEMAHDDTTFDQVLRSTLSGMAPDSAPASLRDFVAAVPGGRRRRLSGWARTAVTVLGPAAAVVAVVVAIGLISAPPAGPAATAPGGAPVASPSPGTVTLAFRVRGTGGAPPAKDQLMAVGDVMGKRLSAFGVGNWTSTGSDDLVTFEVPLRDASRASVAAVRDLLGATGELSVALLGPDPVETGDRVTVVRLFTGDAVTDARTGTDQGGIPTLDLTLDRDAAVALADATRGHVGEYLAFALDGRAIAVPMINEEIRDGRIQVSFAGDDATTPARLAAILQSGPLPVPVEAVTP